MRDRTRLGILMTASLGVSLLLAELILRMVFGTPVHFRYPQERYVPEPVIGHWLEPGQSTFTHHHPVHVNSIGLRDRDYPREVPAGRYRLRVWHPLMSEAEDDGRAVEVGDQKTRVDIRLSRSLRPAPLSGRPHSWDY